MDEGPTIKVGLAFLPPYSVCPALSCPSQSLPLAPATHVLQTSNASWHCMFQKHSVIFSIMLSQTLHHWNIPVPWTSQRRQHSGCPNCFNINLDHHLNVQSVEHLNASVCPSQRYSMFCEWNFLDNILYPFKYLFTANILDPSMFCTQESSRLPRHFFLKIFFCLQHLLPWQHYVHLWFVTANVGAAWWFVHSNEPREIPGDISGSPQLSYSYLHSMFYQYSLSLNPGGHSISTVL